MGDLLWIGHEGTGSPPAADDFLAELLIGNTT